MANPSITITLSQAQARLLLDALDSHAYWQVLAEHEATHLRHDGYAPAPESVDDPDLSAALREVELVQEALSPLLRHAKDEDCDVDEDTETCRGCGVRHGDPCDDCGGRGYHRLACPTQDPEKAGTIA